MPSGGQSACGDEGWVLWQQASSGKEARQVPARMGSRTWGLATGPRGWNPRHGPTSQDAAPHRHPVGGPHLPQCQDQQGQQQEAPQCAAHNDPDGDLPVFLLGDLKRDLQGEEGHQGNRLASWGLGGAWGLERRRPPAPGGRAASASLGKAAGGMTDGIQPAEASEPPAPAQWTPELSGPVILPPL